MRPYVKKITSNLQGGVAADLGPKTLIVGPNATGKSAITRSVELATSGCASDVAGRVTLALDAELASLMPGDVSIMETEAVFSDSGSGRWSLTRGKRSKRVGSTAAFPLRDVREALLGSVETARKFFLQHAAGLTWEAFLEEVPPQFHTRLAPFRSADVASAVTAALEGTKKMGRAAADECRASRRMAAQTTAGLPPPPTEEEMQRAAKGIADAALVERTTAARDRLGKLRAVNRIVAVEAIETAEAKLQAWQAKLDSIPRVNDVPPIVEHIIETLKHAVSMPTGLQGEKVCPTCAVPHRPEVFADRLAKANASISAIIETSKKRREAESARSEAEVTLSLARKDLEAIDGEINTLSAIVSTSGVDALAPPPENYAELSQRAAAWKTARELEARAATLEGEALAAGQCMELIKIALERMLSVSLKGFIAKVQSFLPTRFVFGAELHDGEREVFRVGLKDPSGFLRSALCGAEWSAVTSAIAAACAPDSGAVIVIPEDRDFDPATLAEVMTAFSGFDGQVILTGTKEPAREVPGWTVIRVSDPRASDPRFCAKCGTTIVIGECEHGVKGRPSMKPGDEEKKPSELEKLLGMMEKAT